jgi:hypothetical protein
VLTPGVEQHLQLTDKETESRGGGEVVKASDQE